MLSYRVLLLLFWLQYVASQGGFPDASSEDNEVDIVKIGENLKALVKDITSLFEAESLTSSATATTPSTVTQTSEPMFITGLAAACTSVQSAYAQCNSATPTGTAGANFTSVPRLQQAKCLCNAGPYLNLNLEMKSCLNWTAMQNGSDRSLASNFQSYATVIANATALCTSSSVPCTTRTIVPPLGITALVEPNPCIVVIPSVGPPTLAPSLPTKGGSARAYGGVEGRWWGWGCSVLPMALLLIAFVNSLG